MVPPNTVVTYNIEIVTFGKSIQNMSNEERVALTGDVEAGGHYELLLM